MYSDLKPVQLQLHSNIFYVLHNLNSLHYTVQAQAALLGGCPTVVIVWHTPNPVTSAWHAPWWALEAVLSPPPPPSSTSDSVSTRLIAQSLNLIKSPHLGIKTLFLDKTLCASTSLKSVKYSRGPRPWLKEVWGASSMKSYLGLTDRIINHSLCNHNFSFYHNLNNVVYLLEPLCL